MMPRPQSSYRPAVLGIFRPALVAGMWLMFMCFAQAQNVSQYEVKAAMLYRFAQFMDWPTNQVTATNAPLVFGIAGQDPFGTSIDTVLKGQKIGQRAILIERQPQPVIPTSCHLLFLSNSLGGETDKTISSLRTNAVLLVGESDDFTRKGGHVRLYLEESKIRFEINIAALERSGLKMSPQVLKLASRVTRDGKDVKK
jgi:hypothetical protein